MGMIGCIYIPASRALQANNKRRPEAIVGKHKQIELGTTRLVDAILAANAQISDDEKHHSSASNGLFVMFVPSRPQVRLSADRQSVALSYSLRVGNIVWPLCFATQNDIERRWLILKVDPQDVVIGTETVAELPSELRDEGIAPKERFSPEDLGRLRSAGMLFASDEREKFLTERNQRLQEAARRQEAATRPSTQTTQP